MKKAPLSAKHQARRMRALERFTLRERGPNESQADYDKYLARKQTERDTLRARLQHS